MISTVFALIVAGGSYLLGGFDRLFCTLSADGSDKTVISTRPTASRILTL